MVTWPEVLELLQKLRLEDVPSISLVNCPVPVDPLASLFTTIGLNVAKIEYLKLNFVPPSSQQDLLGNVYSDEFQSRLNSNIYRISFSKPDQPEGAWSHKNETQADRQNIL